MEVVLLQSAQADLLEIYSRHGEASYHVIDRSLERIRLMPDFNHYPEVESAPSAAADIS